MPRILITDLSPSELFERSLTTARRASAEIQRLRDAKLAPGESIDDRLRIVAMHAHALADAFEVIDALAAHAASQECEECEECDNVSPPSPTVPAPGHRGVHQGEEDPNAN